MSSLLPGGSLLPVRGQDALKWVTETLNLLLDVRPHVWLSDGFAG